MIKVCKRCGKDMELPEGSFIKFCQKGSVCFNKRMSEAVVKSNRKKRLALKEPDCEVSDAQVLDKGLNEV